MSLNDLHPLYSPSASPSFSVSPFPEPGGPHLTFYDNKGRWKVNFTSPVWGLPSRKRGVEFGSSLVDGGGWGLSSWTSS